MPPRPFPFPLRVGTDICSISRIRRLIKHDNQSKRLPLNLFLPKLLTWPERLYFWDRFKSPEHAYKELGSVSHFLAGRWAAKEACRKACEHLGRSNGFHSIIVLPVDSIDSNSDGATRRPQGLILRDKLTELSDPNPDGHDTQYSCDRAAFDINAIEGQFCELSISHDTEWATAVAIVPVLEDWKPNSTKDMGRTKI